jgi:uncharacterized membrane protein (DUF485 family)
MSQPNLQERFGPTRDLPNWSASAAASPLFCSLVVLVPYYTFMCFVSSQPQLFAAKISEGSVITIGWPIAAAVHHRWLVADRLFYVNRANGEFDR